MMTETKHNKYTTVSVEKETKTMLDYLRAKKGKSLSVIMHAIVKAEYEREFGMEGVLHERNNSAESGAIPIVG